MSDRLEVAVLGPVEARKHGVPVGLAGSKLQALVALLALGAPHPTSGERLIDELWGERPPGNPSNALQAQISQMRRLLGRDAVVRQGPGYRLEVEVDDVDANRLERLTKEARAMRDAGDLRRSIATFEQALATVRGQPLTGLEEFEFASRSATRLNELALSALEELIDAQMAAGMHVEIVGKLSELVQLHPTRERLHAQLMLALYRSGRQPDALRAFQRARTVLIEEFGVEPGVALATLERSILERDPLLDLQSADRLSAAVSQDKLDRGRTESGAETDLSLPRLFGRDAVLAEIVRDVQSSVAGRGRTITLAGEPGIGKSTIAEHAAALAERSGAVVAWGRCFSGGGAPAFWPWSQIIDGLVERCPEDVVRSALRFGGSELAQIASTVRSMVPALDSAAVATDTETAQFRIYEATVGFLRRISQHRPIVVVVDDLHWADPASLQLFSLMSLAAREAAIALVGAHRNVEPYVSGSLAPLLVELARRGEVRRIELAGLDAEAIGEMLRSAGAGASGDSVAMIAERTRGNPFFLSEIIRLLPRDRPAFDTETVRRVVPASVRAAIRSRLARLSVDTVDALSAASVLGEQFDLHVLTGLLTIDRPRLLHALYRAVESGFIIRDEAKPTQFRFCHGLVHDAIYDDLGPEQRCEWHRLAAEALVRQHGDVDGPHVVAVADHWLRAVPVAPAERAIEAARRAAGHAATHLAPEQAERLLRAALELCPALDGGPARSALELALLDELGRLLLTTSGYASLGLDETCRRMRALCDQLDEPGLRAQALWRLAIFHLYRCEFVETADLGRELLQLAADDRPAVAALGHLALGLAANHAGQVRDARAHFDDAIVAGGNAEDSEGLGAAEATGVIDEVFSAWNWVLLDRIDRAEEAMERARSAAEASGESYPQAYAATFETIIAVIRGDVPAALERARRGIDLAAPNGHHFLVPFLIASRGWARAAMGEYDAGLLDIEEGAAGLAAQGVQFWAHVFPAWLADALLAAGLADDAVRAADSGLQLSDESGEAWYAAELHRLRSEALRAGGRTDDADAALATARRVATEQGADLFLRRCSESRRGS